ncbi:MAG: hypothetical protein V4819_14775 [Verrucomicrobiota bacterium]
MSIHIHYRSICEVRIDHDPSLDLGKMEFAELATDLQDLQSVDYDIHQLLEISPTAETEDLMVRQRLRLRRTPQGIALAGSAEGDMLERPTEPGMSLWLLIFPRVPAFAASANLPQDGSVEEIYHFTSRHGGLSLTGEIPVFDPAASYLAGDLVVDADPPNVLLEAVRDLTPAAVAAPADWLELPAPRFQPGADFLAGDRVLAGGSIFTARTDGAHPAPPSAQWLEVTTPDLRNGASRADRVRALKRHAKLPLVPPLPFVRFTLKDSTGAVVESGVRHCDTPGLLDSLELGLPHAPRGVYRIEVTDGSGVALPGFPQDFLVLPEISMRPLGVIELQIGPENPLLFGPGGALLAPVYQLRFRKRHSFWRYQFHGDLAALPPAVPGDPLADGPARFVTPTPLPLTRGVVALRRFGGKIPLPNPPASQVTREGGRLVSDTFIRI